MSQHARRCAKRTRRIADGTERVTFDLGASSYGGTVTVSRLRDLRPMNGRHAIRQK